jgi:HCOMODA/2-hydroxy-3-carboxy-muconic semialdehyde decarboxylase
MQELFSVMRDLVIANRVLANENVVDAFGHLSMRHPTDPDRYVMACSRSPEIVTLDDLMEYTLDNDPVDQRGLPMYAERYIHGTIYAARPDVNAVVHNHSLSVIPFGVTRVKLRPLMHTGSTMGEDIPVWDIREKFGDTTMLVLNNDHGHDLARCLGDHRIALMRGHGCVVVGANIREAVMSSIYLEVNARLQMDCVRLGDPQYMTPGEIEGAQGRFFGELAVNRAWEYWVRRVNISGV